MGEGFKRGMGVGCGFLFLIALVPGALAKSGAFQDLLADKIAEDGVEKSGGLHVPVNEAGNADDSDEARSQRMIGAWELTTTVDGVVQSGREEIKKDHTFRFSGTVKENGQEIPVSCEGTWWFDHGYHTKLTSSMPKIAAARKEDVDQVISMTDDEVVTVTEDNHKEVRHRISH